jgi:hypothetical protein
MSLAIIRALSPPPAAFEVADDSGFPLQFSAVKTGGIAWGRISFLRVTGAGSVTVKFREPRDGAETEAFTLDAGDELPGQITEIVAADNVCFPIKVFR